MEPNKKQVGARIKRIREKDNLTLYEFGSRLGKKLGTDRIKEGIISRWENGKSLPNSKRIQGIAELGRITVGELLYGSIEQFIYKVLIDELSEFSNLYQLIVDYHSKTESDVAYMSESEKENQTEFLLKKSDSFIKDNLYSIVNYISDSPLISSENHIYQDKLLVLDLASKYIAEVTPEFKMIETDPFSITYLKNTHLVKFVNEKNQGLSEYIFNCVISVKDADLLKNSDYVKLDYVSNVQLTFHISERKNVFNYKIDGLQALANKPYQPIFDNIHSDGSVVQMVKNKILNDSIQTTELEKFNLKVKDLKEGL